MLPASGPYSFPPGSLASETSSFRHSAALTIARMPALIAAGSAGQASTTAANSRSKEGSRAPSAPDSAPPDCELALLPEDPGGSSSPVSPTTFVSCRTRDLRTCLCGAVRLRSSSKTVHVYMYPFWGTWSCTVPRTNRPPSYRYHKARKCAVVTIFRKNRYLGPYGSPESHEAYERWLAKWRSMIDSPLPDRSEERL